MDYTETLKAGHGLIFETLLLTVNIWFLRYIHQCSVEYDGF